MTVATIHTKWVRIFGLKIPYFRRTIHVRETHRAGGAW